MPMNSLPLLFFALAAVAAEPGTLEEHKNRARTLLEQQDFAAALDEARAVKRFSADDIEGYQLTAAAHLGRGNYDEAEKAIQWMLDLRIGKADAKGWLLVARFREVTGDLGGAIEAVNLSYVRLAATQTREARALMVYSGRLHCMAGELALATRVLEDVLKAAPQDPGALEALARVRLAQGKWDAAVGLLRELAHTSPHPRHLYELAEATRDRVDWDAFETAARARIATPDNANRELVLYLAGTAGRAAAAEALAIARGESARRHDVLTLDALAAALLANGRAAEAKSVIERVLAVGTCHPEILARAAHLGVKPQP